MSRGTRAEGQEFDPLRAELEEILALTAHELHEPLRKITTFGHLLRDRASGALDDESLDYIARMERAADRMRSTLDGVIVFARVPRGLPFVTIDLGEVVISAVEKMRARLEETRGAVHVGRLPSIEGDPFQMQLFFEHLLDNAVKFAREGVPPVIHVDAVALEEGGVSDVRIADNGQGFEDIHAERIFRPFERLHGRGKYPGAGLGLAICRKIAERHGAQLTAHGEPGEGAVLTLTIATTKPRSPAAGDLP